MTLNKHLLGLLAVTLFSRPFDPLTAIPALKEATL